MRASGPTMRVLLTGATGFVGRALVQRLLGDGHTVLAWVRSPERARHQLGPAVQLVPMQDGERDGKDQALVDALSGCDAVVNLAGEAVIDRRWSAARKRALWTSRVDLTDRLVRAMKRAEPTPRALVSASAVGFYGERGDERLHEQSGRGEGFLAELCEAWEASALAAREAGARVVLLRIGIVLGLGGGALAAMLPAFRLGLGGPMGHGKQYVPWIALDDLVAIFERGMRDERMRGPFNATAPTPLTSRDYARVLGAALDRPAVMPVPALALHAVLGARARVVLQSQCALPVALERLGHAFEHPLLESALDALFAHEANVQVRRVSAEERREPATAAAQYVLEAETLLDAPIELAFAFFCRAENLGLITPSFMHFEILGDAPKRITARSEIEYRIRVGPLPLRWKTVIAQWTPPRSFVDSQERGPYRLWWHEHVLAAEGSQTRMLDRVRYALPFGVLGRLAHALFVRATLRSIFAYRSDAIGRLFAAQAPVALRGVGRGGATQAQPQAQQHEASARAEQPQQQHARPAR